jgi:hypothetical protein
MASASETGLGALLPESAHTEASHENDEQLIHDQQGRATQAEFEGGASRKENGMEEQRSQESSGMVRRSSDLLLEEGEEPQEERFRRTCGFLVM